MNEGDRIEDFFCSKNDALPSHKYVCMEACNIDHGWHSRQTDTFTDSRVVMDIGERILNPSDYLPV